MRYLHSRFKMWNSNNTLHTSARQAVSNTVHNRSSANVDVKPSMAACVIEISRLMFHSRGSLPSLSLALRGELFPPGMASRRSNPRYDSIFTCYSYRSVIKGRGFIYITCQSSNTKAITICHFRVENASL